MGRKHVALQRRVARVLGGWRDPHDTKPYPELDIVQRVDIAEDGEVNFLPINELKSMAQYDVLVPAGLFEDGSVQGRLS